MSLTSADVDAALKSWRDGLVNLSGTNRALNFRHTKSATLAIDSPNGSVIVDGLRTGRTFAFAGRPDDLGGGLEEVWSRRDTAGSVASSPDTATLLTSKVRSELGATLRNLLRKAQAEYLDRGLSVLYLAVGALHWIDVDDTTFTSPILMLPVQLVSNGPKDPPSLVAGDTDVAVNPALALRLADFGVSLPVVGDLAEVDLRTVLDQVSEAVAAQHGWSVEPGTVVLSAFSFQKEAMYRDLKANEAVVAAHPVVRALANQNPLTQSGELLFDPIDPDNIDQVSPPEALPTILDADSSQRACIAAAVAGRSFVMDGPPGTGKSQTIANMIGALLHAGRSVLFVSEKAAALEVVRNRLEHRGLGSYLLELHSHRASRKEVATQLYEALEKQPQPPVSMNGDDRRTLVERRKTLTAYAEAMNRVRAPLGESLHDVLGTLAQLVELPDVPAPTNSSVDLTRDTVRVVQEAAERLASAWRPAAEGASFLWRDVLRAEPLDLLLAQAADALVDLETAAERSSDVRSEFRLDRIGDLSSVLDLLSIAAERPAVTLDSWLTVEGLNPIIEARANLGRLLADQRTADAAALAASGVSWQEVPDLTHISAAGDPTVSTRDGIAVDQLSAADVLRLSRDITDLAARLQRRCDGAARLGHMLHLPPPRTLRDIESVLTLCGAAHYTHRPERAWLTTDGLETARKWRDQLRTRIDNLKAAEEPARRSFTEQALNQPLIDLHQRFTEVHKGLHKLSGSYWRDRKTVAAFKAEVASLRVAINDLELAVKWSNAAIELASTQTGASAVLGPYARGEQTDFDDLDSALALADRIVQLTPPESLSSVAAYVTSPEPDTAVPLAVADIRADLDDIRRQFSSSLINRPELLLEPYEDQIRWLRAQVPTLDRAAQHTLAVDHATGRSNNVGAADTVLQLRQAAAAATTRLTDAQYDLATVLGSEHVRGTSTDLTHLDRCLEWTIQVRSFATGEDSALNAGQAKALTRARSNPQLRPALQAWSAAAQALISSFAPIRHLELDVEFDGFATASSLIEDLRHDSGGQAEWFAYIETRSVLAGKGLDPAAEYCVEHRVEPELVPATLRRALLRGWADDA